MINSLISIIARWLVTGLVNWQLFVLTLSFGLLGHYIGEVYERDRERGREREIIDILYLLGMLRC